MERWVCPNDRQLALRAKLGTGWSVHTSKVSSFAKNDQLTTDETEKILRVIKQAEMLEQLEMERIGHLVEKVEHMRNNTMGNGQSQCILCGDEFGLLGASPSYCDDCTKAVCSKCGVDTFNAKRQAIWLCKICSENRELWRKSGAWFYKGLPKYTKPLAKKQDLSSLKMSDRNIARPRGVPKSYNAWSRSNASRTSDPQQEPNGSSEQESSESEDEVNIIRKRVKPLADSESDSVSLESSFSNQLNQSLMSSNLSCGSQWSITESAREDHHSGNEIENSGTTVLNQDDSNRTQSFVNRCNNNPNMSPPPKLQLPSNYNHLPEITCTASEDKDLLPPATAAIMPETPASLGILEFTLFYDSKQKTLRCTIHKATSLPAMDSNGLSDPYVKLHLLPGANRSTKLRTKTIPKNRNPEWHELLEYHGVTDVDMQQKTLRLSVFDEDKIGSDFIGETRVVLKSLQFDRSKDFSVYLSGLQVEKLQHSAPSDRGRILLSLFYDSNKEQLTIGVKRCAGLLAMDSNGYSDPYVKLYLKPDKEKKTKRKTKVKTKTLNPEFNEEFNYSIKVPDLCKKTLDITVWDKDFGKSSDYIGGVQLGTSATGEQLRHWYETIKNPNKIHEQWHILSEKVLPDVK